MPPKTRGNKFSKLSKENIGVRTKATSKVVNLPRKVLSDKTNSGSDDNISFLQLKLCENNVGKEQNSLVKQRPRRERRLPTRYVENNDIQNVSKTDNTSVEYKDGSKSTPLKRIPLVKLSPLKTPKLILDSSLTAKRPKRICRLPSKLNDHSISPSKYIPVQPAYASTPKIVSKPTKQIEKKGLIKKAKPKNTNTSDNKLLIKANKRTNKKNNDIPKINSANSSADTNNNAKTDQISRSKTKNKQSMSPKLSGPNTRNIANTKLTAHNFSIKILDDKKKPRKRDASKIDVYEFTYDPNEEPPPQKKKRKKPTKKREPKPKTVVFRDNYDKNLAKVLRNLKNTISEKSSKSTIKMDNAQVLSTHTCAAQPSTDTVVSTADMQPILNNACNYDKSRTSANKYNSVRVEDIALDFEDSCVDDINYSPVHSYCQPPNPVMQNDIQLPEMPVANNQSVNIPPSNDIPNLERPASTNDPLNLRDDLSFFDDQPVASSSMNVSTRNPAASPWRVEFGRLPIKWQVNTYVKPNMTPAFESSFMNFNDSKKKHIYTNMVADTNEENNLPQIYDDYTSKLKQTSIISFIKEVVERSSKKKKEKLSPIKTKSLFEDLNNTSVHKGVPLEQNDHVTPKKTASNNIQSNEENNPPIHCVENTPFENSDTPNILTENEKDSSKENTKTSSKKKKDKDLTYFGFDDSENNDQENVSPVKKIDKQKLRALKPRSRTVLQEINAQKRPTRAVLPVAVKSKPIENTDAANKLFDQMKSATEPPDFPDPVPSTETTNITEIQNNVDSNDDQSVHLFEDIEAVHHFKAHRKSYGKAKKAVTFRQNSVSDSDVAPSDAAEQSVSSDEDDLLDLTFKVPAVEPKKASRKKKSKRSKISKKEEKEVEAWAAGFNSMCEDIEEFDLVVE